MGEQKPQNNQLSEASLLGDAVTELNVARRSAGLYPSNHPIARQSIRSAFVKLQKVFELRGSISIGITKDTLIVGEYTLDKKNPVYRELALALYRKALSSITFISGITEEELLTLNELITAKDGPIGRGLVELAEKKGLRYIRLLSIDLSKFEFIGNATRKSGNIDIIWETYIYALIEGRLAEDESSFFVDKISPQNVASIVNDYVFDDAPEGAYERVINAYTKRKGDSRLSIGAFHRFTAFLSHLNPEKREQFLSKAYLYINLDETDIDNIVKHIRGDDIDRIMKLFGEHFMLPKNFRILIDKLSELREVERHPYIKGEYSNLVADIELSENIMKLFRDDQVNAFVSNDYQKELENILNASEFQRTALAADIEKTCSLETVDDRFLDIILKLVSNKSIIPEDFSKLLTEISELLGVFLNTGRLLQINKIVSFFHSQDLTGDFKDKALSVLDLYYSSMSISQFINAIKISGGRDREAAVMLARNLGKDFIRPLLDVLCEDTDARTRMLLLYVLSNLNSDDVLSDAVKRLRDEKWYVKRNMIYLIRECGGVQYANKVSQFTRHENNKLVFEAVKTLIHFNSPDALSYLKLCLKGNDPELKSQAIELAGSYRVSDAVPHLLEIFNKKEFSSAALQYKIDTVKALGRIGDPIAIKDLIKLYNSKSLLFKKAFDELRVEIFKNLKHYPIEPLKPLLQAGIASKNDEVRKISEKLMARSGNV